MTSKNINLKKDKELCSADLFADMESFVPIMRQFLIIFRFFF